MIEVIRNPLFVLVIFGPETDLDSCSVRPPAEQASGCQSKMVPFRSDKNAELIFVPSRLSSQQFSHLDIYVHTLDRLSGKF